MKSKPSYTEALWTIKFYTRVTDANTIKLLNLDELENFAKYSIRSTIGSKESKPIFPIELF